VPSCGTIVEAASQRLPKAAHFLRRVNAQDKGNLFTKGGGLVLDEGFSSLESPEMEVLNACRSKRMSQRGAAEHRRWRLPPILI